MTPYVPISGDYALVTGAGSGIGRFLCHYFARRKMQIISLDIDGDAARETAAQCKSMNVEARSEAVDVSDRDAMVGLADRLSAESIVPSVLWANAGVGSAAATITAKPAAIEWLYGVNVLGSIWTGQAFLPHMLKRRDACHVGITASSASVTPVSGPFTLYATTKQATAAVGEAWMAELAEYDIGVTILCPGILDTAIWNSARSRPDRFGGSRLAPDDAGAHWRKQPAP
ncbi:MAG: SDR family NAD(P)-dependent oxidoreductase, partial [Pontixanthobacter sp.]